MQLENCIRNAYDLEGRHIGHLVHSFCISSQYASNISVEIFIFETWSFAPRSLISMNHAYDSVMCNDKWTNSMDAAGNRKYESIYWIFLVFKYQYIQVRLDH
jgi:hypothetical protein